MDRSNESNLLDATDFDISGSGGSNPKSRLIGRDDELVLLEGALECASTGSAQVVAIAGEPGIGKTILKSELILRAENRGFKVAQVACTDLSGAPPLWPWQEALGQLPDSAGALQQISHDASSDPTENPDSRRFQLCTGVVATLRSASESDPLLVVFDDMQWGDSSTQDLFAFVATQLSSSSVLLAACVRTSESELGASSRAMLSSISRLHNYVSVNPRLLNSQEVRGLVEQTIQHTVTKSVAEQIAARSKGVPLFVRELSSQVDERGQRLVGNLPQGIRDLLGSRFDQLEPKTKTVLQGAAVLGSAFKPVEVAELFNRSESGSTEDNFSPAALISVLDEASSAGITQSSSTSTGLFEFSHPLYAEVARSRLPAGERASLHAAAAAMLEESLGSDAEAHASSIVRHHAEAAVVYGHDKLVYYSLIAGQSALRTFAYAEALDHFEAVRQVFEDQPNRIELAHAWFGIARARFTFESKWGSSLTAAEIHRGLTTAFEIFIAHGETDLAIEVASQGIVTSQGDPWFPPSDLSARGLELASDDSILTARLLTRHADTLFADPSRIEESDLAFERATAMARRHDDPALLIKILRIRAQGAGHDHMYDRAISLCDSALELKNRVSANMDLGLAEINGGIALGSLGNVDDANRRIDFGYGMLQEIGIESNLYHLAKASIEFRRGNFQAVMRHGRELDRIEDAPVTGLYHVLEEVYTGSLSLALAETRKHLSDLPQIQPKISFMAIYVSLIARIGRELDDVEAIDEAHSFVKNLQSENLGARADTGRIRWLRAIVAIATHNAGSARIEYEEQLPQQGTFDLRNTGEIVDLLLGQLAWTFGDQQLALGHYQKALEFCRKGGMGLSECETIAAYAGALIERGSRVEIAQAVELLKSGIEIANTRGLVNLATKMDDLMTRATRGKVLIPGGLTEREVEVVQLIADGLSNPQIAKELFISPNTVLRHVSNIFGKLGVTSRTEAAVEAVNLGVAVRH